MKSKAWIKSEIEKKSTFDAKLKDYTLKVKYVADFIMVVKDYGKHTNEYHSTNINDAVNNIFKQLNAKE